MKRSGRTAAKSIFVLYLIFLHFVLAGFVYERLESNFAAAPPVDTAAADPLAGQPLVTPLPLPTFSERSAVNNAENSNLEFMPEAGFPSDALMIPVIGVKREQLHDTFSDSRSEGRAHNAIDIAAPPGTPVVAAADGEIAGFFDSVSGGITIYQYNRDKTMVYYYAHLERRADSIKEKDFVKRGTVIGYVGNTGNAGEGNYHLHFSISRIENPGRYFEGENINPFPLLQNAIEAR